MTVPDLATTNGPATIVMLATAFGGDIDNTEPAWERLPALADQLVTTYRRSSELTTLIREEEAWVAPLLTYGDEMMNSPMKLGPDSYTWGDVEVPQVAMPGTTKFPKAKA